MKYDVYVTRSQMGNFATWMCEETKTGSYIVSVYSKEGWHLRDQDAVSASVLRTLLKQEAEVISHCEHYIGDIPLEDHRYDYLCEEPIYK